MDWINISDFWVNNDIDDADRHFYFLLNSGKTKKGFISEYENISVKYATIEVDF